MFPQSTHLQLPSQKGTPIEKGASAIVYKRQSGDKFLAVKDFNAKSYQYFENELSFLKLIGNHPSIIRYIGSCDITLMIEMELATKGDLHDFIHRKDSNQKPDYPAKRAYYLLLLAKGLSYLKSKNILHRDIKPANVLITEKDEIKLCDFGYAYQLASDETEVELDRAVGTPPYAAPEIMLSDFLDDPLYSYASDLWAFGIIVWEMYSLQKAYQICREGNQAGLGLLRMAFLRGVTPNPGVIVDKPLCKINEKILSHEPEDRPSIEEVIPVLEDLEDNYQDWHKQRKVSWDFF